MGIKLILKDRFNSDFSKNVFLLLTGTGIAQAIPILISPLLTRLYSPHDFGVLGLYLSCVSILSAIASGRYDFSIIEPKFDSDAKTLMSLAIVITLSFSVSILILAIVGSGFFSAILGDKDIKVWIYFIPISIVALTCNSIFSYWMNRKKMYKEMSVNRIISSLSVSIISLTFGVVKVFSGGLILGNIIGQSLAVYLLQRKIINNEFEFQFKRKLVLMKKYSHYPKFLIPGTLAGEIAAAVPIILITRLFNSTITGYFSLANRVIALPISFLGNAIGEVYRQKASEEYSRNGSCKKLYLSALKKLAVIGTIPLFILFFFSEQLFSIVFGSNWIEAGMIAKCLSFMIFFQLLSTPLAYTITFNKSQKYDMHLQFFRAFFSVIAIYVGYYLGNYKYSIILYTIVYSIYYILHSILQYRSAAGFSNRL